MCIPSQKSQAPAPAASVIPSIQSATNPVLGDPAIGSRGASLLGRLALRLGSGGSSSAVTGGGGTVGSNAGTSSPGTGTTGAPSVAASLGLPGLGLRNLRLGGGALA